MDRDGTGLGSARSSRAQLFGRYGFRCVSAFSDVGGGCGGGACGCGAVDGPAWGGSSRRGGGGGGGRGGEGGGGRALSWMADCDFFSDFDGTLGAFPAVGSVPGGHIGLGGGLTIRPLPPSPSITFSANLGRGRIKASHHVSAESHRCLPFGRTDAVSGCTQIWSRHGRLKAESGRATGREEVCRSGRLMRV